MSTNNPTSQTTPPLYITFLPASSSVSSSISASESSSVSSTSTSYNLSTTPNNGNILDDGYLLAQPSEASNEPSEYSSEEVSTNLESTTGMEQHSTPLNQRTAASEEEESPVIMNQPSEYLSEGATNAGSNFSGLHPDQRSLDPDHGPLDPDQGSLNLDQLARLTLREPANNSPSYRTREHPLGSGPSTTDEESSRASSQPTTQSGNVQDLHPDQESLAPDHPAMLTLHTASDRSSEGFSEHSINGNDSSSSSTGSSLEQQDEARSSANQPSVASGPGLPRKIEVPAPSRSRNPFAQLHPAWQHLGELGLARIITETFDDPTETQYQQTTLTTPMLNENIHWGDLPTATEKDSVRVWFQNIQGLPWKSSDKFNQVMTTMKDHDATIMGFNEPNMGGLRDQ